MASVAPEKQLTNGFVSLIGGGNDAVDPLLVSDAEFSRGLNVSVRRGLVGTRPRWKKLKSMSDGGFQGAFAYRRNSGDRLAVVLGGTAYALRMSDLEVETWKASAFTNKQRCYFVKADRFCVVQDGIKKALIFDGPDNIGDTDVPAGTLKASGAAMTGTYSENFPIGYIMAYAHGRIFLQAKYAYDNNGNAITNEDGRPYFIASDVVLSYRPKNCLLWTVTDYLNEGGGFSLPEDYGFIHGMLPFRNAQTAQDVGSLVVACRDGIAAYKINAPRSQWKEFDLSTILFSNNGTLSPFSMLNVNDDIFYRGGRVGDGLRTIRYTVSEVSAASGSLSNTPISSEVQYVTDMDTEADLPFVSLAVVNNRVCMTSGGRDADGSFRALVVVDANVSSQMKKKSPPVYNGIWTGLGFQQITAVRYDGQERLVAMHKRGVTNEVWMLDEEGAKDNDTTDILCRVYTKVMPFVVQGRSSLTDRKRFHYLDLIAKNIVGNVEVTVYYRPYGYPLWTKGSTGQIKADSGGLGQMRDPIRLSTIREVSDIATGDITEVATAFEFCIEWRGKMTIQQAVFTCSLESSPDEPVGVEETEVLKIEADEYQTELNDFEYTVS